MSSDLVRMLNLDYLYPLFLEKLLDALTECRLLGYNYKCYSGYRSHDEQRKLYEAYLAGGSRAAPAGLSAHNYGLAVDCARIVEGGKLSWDPEHYDTLLKILPKHSLMSGRNFKDLPHVQWPSHVTGKDFLKLKTVYNAASGDELSRLKAVWEFLDGL